MLWKVNVSDSQVGCLLLSSNRHHRARSSVELAAAAEEAKRLARSWRRVLVLQAPVEVGIGERMKIVPEESRSRGVGSAAAEGDDDDHGIGVDESIGERSMGKQDRPAAEGRNFDGCCRL